MVKGTKLIRLTQGYHAIVDVADYEVLKWHGWCIRSNPAGNLYAVARIRQKNVSMHRFLLDVPAGKEVDHINGNGLDNRRINLRIVSRSQNNCNQYKLRGSYSRFKGVTWDKQKRRWNAQITSNKRHIHLGHWKSELEAARAYDIAAMQLHGEFARINFPA